MYCGILWYTLSPLVDASHVLVYVLDVVLRREELVEVVDGSQQLLTQKRLTLAMLSFLRRREGEYVRSCVVCEAKGLLMLTCEVVCCVCVYLHKVEADGRRAEPLQTGHEMEGSWRCKWSGTINWTRKNERNSNFCSDNSLRSRFQITYYNVVLTPSVLCGGINPISTVWWY